MAPETEILDLIDHDYKDYSSAMRKRPASPMLGCAIALSDASFVRERERKRAGDWKRLFLE